MLEVKLNDHVAIIDVREQILRGEHPKQEIIDFIKTAKRGTVLEVHLPHPAKPLTAAIEALGINTIMNHIGSDHYRLLCIVI